MSIEIRLSVIVRLSDEPLEQATQAQAVMAAWCALTAAIVPVAPGAQPDFYIGPAKSEPARRRRGRAPRLTLADPAA
jgi:hypothetical protein